MEKIQSLGFYGIFKESFAIALSWRNIFSQITITTIFPLSLFFLIRSQISEFLFADHILHKHKILMDTLWSEKIAFLLFEAVYFLFFLVLSSVSTSTVVYTIARIYTTNEITFAEVMNVVPKVWKRVLVTLTWSFIIVLVYNMISFSILVPWLEFNIGPSTSTGPTIWGPLFAVYMMGFVCISIIWHLASVVSVLEEDYGIEAMMKSMALVKGKMVISVAIFMVLNLCFIFIEVASQRFVVVGDQSIWGRIGYGILFFLLLSGFTLLGLIIQTLVYLVCKLDHQEIIDKSYIGDHLEVYIGDYDPLRSKDVKLEQF